MYTFISTQMVNSSIEWRKEYSGGEGNTVETRDSLMYSVTLINFQLSYQNSWFTPNLNNKMLHHKESIRR